jgi:hypothetical protein
MNSQLEHHIQLPLVSNTTNDGYNNNTNNSIKMYSKSNDSSIQTLNWMEILLERIAKFCKGQPVAKFELDALENMCVIVDAAIVTSEGVFDIIFI